MSTTIHSLGSKWYGEEADPIETLFKVLAEHPLSRVFEAYGNFIGPREDGHTGFWGNFHELSCVFNIVTDDPDLVARLTKAIRDNQRRADYLSQPEPVEWGIIVAAGRGTHLRPASAEDAGRARVLGDPETGEHVDVHGQLVRLEPPDELVVALRLPDVDGAIVCVPGGSGGVYGPRDLERLEGRIRRATEDETAPDRRCLIFLARHAQGGVAAMVDLAGAAVAPANPVQVALFRERSKVHRATPDCQRNAVDGEGLLSIEDAVALVERLPRTASQLGIFRPGKRQRVK